jgi:hypothetical protein
MASDKINIVGLSVACTAQGGQASFTILNYSSPAPGEYGSFSYEVFNVTNATEVSVASGGSSKTNYKGYVYNLASGIYRIDASNQNGDSVSSRFEVRCTPVCDLGQPDNRLQVLSNVPVSGSNRSDGSVIFNNPSLNSIEYSLSSVFTTWQGSPIFAGLPAGNFTGYVRRNDFVSCSDSVSFSVSTVVSKNDSLSIQVVNITPATNKTLNNGGATLLLQNCITDRTYQVKISPRGNSSLPLLQFFYSGGSTTYQEALFGLAAYTFDAVVIETDVDGNILNKSTSFVIPNKLRGCTNPKAKNYNSNATIEDDSCVFPTGNTGNKAYRTLEQYYPDDMSVTGLVKPNIETDPDYIAPVLDTNSCPL